MTSTSVLLDVPLDDDDSIEIWVDIKYEKVFAEPDVGIMKDYADITDIEIPDDVKGSRFAADYLSSDFAIIDIQEKIEL